MPHFSPDTTLERFPAPKFCANLRVLRQSPRREQWDWSEDRKANQESQNLRPARAAMAAERPMAQNRASAARGRENSQARNRSRAHRQAQSFAPAISRRPGLRPATLYRAAYGRATEPRERDRGSRPCRVTIVAARLTTIGVAVAFELSNLSRPATVPAKLPWFGTLLCGTISTCR